MRNPNANVALTVGGVVIAAEQLAQTYLDAHIGPFWSKAIVGAAVYVVLLIGRDGVQGALRRILAVARAIWKGQAVSKSPAPPAA